MMTSDMLSTMVNRIIGKFNPVGILLFGSHARGDTRKWSDVDLLVIMDSVSDKRQTAIEIQCLLDDLSFSKDIVVTTQDEIDKRRHIVGTLIREAFRDGRMLYERSGVV